MEEGKSHLHNHFHHKVDNVNPAVVTMATEPSKKLDEQHNHDQRQHAGGGMDLASHVDLNMMTDAILVRILYIVYTSAIASLIKCPDVLETLTSCPLYAAQEVRGGNRAEAGG